MSQELSNAIKNHDIATVSSLLANGADPNWLDPQTEQPLLHLAVLHAQTEIIVLLLNQGIDVNRQAIYPPQLPMTALDCAFFQHKRINDPGLKEAFAKICQLLLKANAQALNPWFFEQNEIVDALAAMGHRPEIVDGICNGLAVMGINALLCKNIAYFNQLLCLICTIPARQLRNEIALANSKRLQRQPLSAEDNLLLDIEPLLEGIDLAQCPNANIEFFNPYLQPSIFRETQNVLLSTPLLRPDYQDEVVEVDFFSGIYSIAELEAYFTLLKQTLLANQFTHPFALYLTNGFHTVSTGSSGFTTPEDKWCLIDASQVVGHFLDEKNMSQSLMRTFSHEEQTSSLTATATRIYVSKQHKAAMLRCINELKNTRAWQDLHRITREKANLKDTRGTFWVSVATRNGETETVKQLLHFDFSIINFVKHNPFDAMVATALLVAFSIGLGLFTSALVGAAAAGIAFSIIVLASELAYRYEINKVKSIEIFNEVLTLSEDERPAPANFFYRYSKLFLLGLIVTGITTTAFISGGTLPGIILGATLVTSLGIAATVVPWLSPAPYYAREKAFTNTHHQITQSLPKIRSADEMRLSHFIREPQPTRALKRDLQYTHNLFKPKIENQRSEDFKPLEFSHPRAKA